MSRGKELTNEASCFWCKQKLSLRIDPLPSVERASVEPASKISRKATLMQTMMLILMQILLREKACPTALSTRLICSENFKILLYILRYLRFSIVLFYSISVEIFLEIFFQISLGLFLAADCSVSFSHSVIKLNTLYDDVLYRFFRIQTERVEFYQSNISTHTLVSLIALSFIQEI